jgi:hypothetical protein
MGSRLEICDLKVLKFVMSTQVRFQSKIEFLDFPLKTRVCQRCMLKKDRFFIRIPVDREVGKKPAEIRTSMWGKNLHKSGTQGEAIIQKLPHWRESILAKTRTSRWGKNLQISGSRCGEKICTNLEARGLQETCQIFKFWGSMGGQKPANFCSSRSGKNLPKSGPWEEPVIQEWPRCREIDRAKTWSWIGGRNLPKIGAGVDKNLPIFEAREISEFCVAKFGDI